MNTQDQTSELAANALATLAKALEAGNSQTLLTYLSVMARFHDYSWGNSLLIALQRPTASRVAGFHSWLKLGRHVRKGEKGIAILAPVVCKVESDQDQPKRGEQTTAPGLKRLVGFRAAYVFDLAQTDGKNLPQFASVTGDPDKNTQLLQELAASRGITLDYDPSIAPARGVSRGRRISILPGLEPAEEFSTLVHEIAHELLHRDERRKQTTKTVRETEAEAVAFVVCQAIGLDTNTAAADYIQLYNGDTATLAASLQLIRSIATEILIYLKVSHGSEREPAEA